MSRQVFIGGTGRSGTTILYQALGSHQELHAFPWEMRFLTDSDGLIDVLNNLTRDYSMPRARESLVRFEALMRCLSDRYQTPYIGYDLATYFGREFFWKRTEQLLDDLTSGTYFGTHNLVKDSIGQRIYMPLVRRMNRNLKRVVARLMPRRKVERPPTRKHFPLWPKQEIRVVDYFSDRSQAAGIIARYVDELFASSAKQHGKTGWVEKTPSNLLHLRELRELFPDSKFIHIKRDPRGVVQSLAQQDWSPTDLEMCCLFIKGSYEKWLKVRSEIPDSNSWYLEIQLERLARDPAHGLQQIAEFLGLENRFAHTPSISIDKVDYWRQSMTGDQTAQINQSLGNIIRAMGYQ